MAKLSHQTTETYGKTNQLTSKRAISGYFSQVELLYSSVTLGDVYKELSFPKLLHGTAKTIGLHSEAELSARN